MKTRARASQGSGCGLPAAFSGYSSGDYLIRASVVSDLKDFVEKDKEKCCASETMYGWRKVAKLEKSVILEQLRASIRLQICRAKRLYPTNHPTCLPNSFVLAFLVMLD